MKRAVGPIVACFVVIAAVAIAIAVLLPVPQTTSPQKQAAHGESEKDDHGADRVEMSDDKIAAASISLEKAGAATLSDTLLINGTLRANQEALVQVTPRFPGVVRDIRKRIGDRVQKGDLLATVESNQSLTSYDLKAPITGTVIDRQISLGEYASEQKPAFTIADLSTIWVDLSVYRADIRRIHIGDKVLIDPEDGDPPAEAEVFYVSPIGSSETQSALVRAVVANHADGHFRPGLFVRAQLSLTGRPVPVAVKLGALQTLENKTVVFVREGNMFEARPVRIGDKDARHAEILSGLSAGDVYAVDNSFVIKAEIGKEDAAHDH
jgi:cobalt-zinc-cadmium efflux system membrane fusion protein